MSICLNVADLLFLKINKVFHCKIVITFDPLPFRFKQLSTLTTTTDIQSVKHTGKLI